MFRSRSLGLGISRSCPGSRQDVAVLGPLGCQAVLSQARS